MLRKVWLGPGGRFGPEANPQGGAWERGPFHSIRIKAQRGP